MGNWFRAASLKCRFMGAFRCSKGAAQQVAAERCARREATAVDVCAGALGAPARRRDSIPGAAEGAPQGQVITRAAMEHGLVPMCADVPLCNLGPNAGYCLGRRIRNWAHQCHMLLQKEAEAQEQLDAQAKRMILATCKVREQQLEDFKSRFRAERLALKRF